MTESGNDCANKPVLPGNVSSKMANAILLLLCIFIAFCEVIPMGCCNRSTVMLTLVAYLSYVVKKKEKTNIPCAFQIFAFDNSLI